MNNTWLLPLTLVLGVVIGAFMGSQMALHAAAPDADQKAKSPTRFKVPDDVENMKWTTEEQLAHLNEQLKQYSRFHNNLAQRVYDHFHTG